MFVRLQQAVFGRTTPRDNTPDNTILQPSTMYGVTKVHLELLGQSPLTFSHTKNPNQKNHQMERKNQAL